MTLIHTEAYEFNKIYSISLKKSTLESIGKKIKKYSSFILVRQLVDSKN